MSWWGGVILIKGWKYALETLVAGSLPGGGPTPGEPRLPLQGPAGRGSGCSVVGASGMGLPMEGWGVRALWAP